MSRKKPRKQPAMHGPTLPPLIVPITVSVSELKRLLQGNTRLKKLVAEQDLEIEVMKEITAKVLKTTTTLLEVLNGRVQAIYDPETLSLYPRSMRFTVEYMPLLLWYNQRYYYLGITERDCA
ncbi:MAG: hypothetical protein RQ867_00885 [Mariprofundaceae bacterium]|nr:hypothetical protein [Mariprofundaceae bacterium]